MRTLSITRRQALVGASATAILATLAAKTISHLVAR